MPLVKGSIYSKSNIYIYPEQSIKPSYKAKLYSALPHFMNTLNIMIDYNKLNNQI